MSYLMPPERKQELMSAVEQYMRSRYDTLRLPAIGNWVCYDMHEETEEDQICAPAPSAPEEAPHKTAASTEDDWEVLERVFERKQGGATVHDLIEEADREETFSEALLRIIAQKELTDPEVYNSVFMDRKLFNKIRNTPNYQPTKRTALLLAVALKLDLEQTNEFIGKAGFRLSRWNKFDIIVEYFIVNGNYNVLDINEILAAYKQPLLLRCD